MIVHAEINQDGKLETPLPKQFRGKRVVLSVVNEDTPLASNWQTIKKSLQAVDDVARKDRHINDILSDLRLQRETH